MKHRNWIRTSLAVVMATGLATAPGYAQIPQGKSHKESFDQFRQRIKGDYKQFRETLLENYSDFLAGEWHEYKSLNGTVSDRTPKPKIQPHVKEKPEKPHNDKPSLPSVPSQPEKPSEIPVIKHPTPAPPTPPAEKPKSDSTADRFLFYNLPVQISHADYGIERKLYSNADYAAQWRSLDKQGVAETVVPGISTLARNAGLNGFLTFRLAEAYVNTKFADKDASSKTALLHYLLAHMGYDARLAITSDGTPMLLLPLDRTVHARTYLMLDRKKYYIFTPEGVDQSKIAGKPISTCRIPEELNQARDIDMLLGRLDIPFKGKAFDIQYGSLHISGEVNENLIPILYRYPQMQVSEYAKCNPDPKLRESVTGQIREQLADFDSDRKAEEFLGFMHRAFDYATDEDFHGFEKPYFIEETLYYPKNDCEDRAIFYTYFLWNSLGKEAQLITFPGHAAATVRLEKPVDGVSYRMNGETFWISDPTYTGSHTGMIMPPYRDTPPTVELTYGK